MYLLISTYLAFGAVVPHHEHRLYSQDELKECRETAALYVKRAVGGQAWAHCAKVKKW